MKKFYLVLSFFLALGGLRAVQAQDTTRCNASFTVIDLPGTTVTFYAADSLPGVIHRWNFGDSTGTTTDSAIVTHVYRQIGVRPVTQTVIDSARHCQDSATSYVISGLVPACGIYITETIDSVHHLYTFVANPTFTTGYADTVRWTINDTAAGQGDTLMRYLPAGPYNVCAFMTTGNGCRSQSCLTIYPYDSVPNTPPPPPDTCTISFTAAPKDHVPNQYVFTVVDQQDYDSIFWRISGPDSLFAGPFQGPSFSYTFADTGYYLIYVAAEKNAGCQVSNGQAIHIDSLAAPSGQSITSYPNPATTQATLNVTLTSSATINVQVYNSMGGLVLTSNAPGYPGVNSITVPIASLPKGMYYIQVQYGSTILRSKVQKLSN